MADVGVGPNEYLGLGGPLGEWFGREVLGGRQREEEQLNLARQLFQPPAPSVAQVPAGYRMGADLGESASGQGTPPEDQITTRMGQLEDVARVNQMNQGLGGAPNQPVPREGPSTEYQATTPYTPPYRPGNVQELTQEQRQTMRQQAESEQQQGLLPGKAPRREPIQRQAVVPQFRTEVTQGQAPSFAQLMLNPRMSTDQVRALQKWGPGLEELRQGAIREEGFQSFEQNLAKGMPFYKAFEAALPAIMRNSKGTQLDDVLRAYNVARQGGSLEDIAKSHEAAGEYGAANAARAGITAYAHYLDNMAKGGREEAGRQALEGPAKYFESINRPDLAAIVRAGRAGGPAAGVISTEKREEGAGTRQTQRETGQDARQARALQDREAGRQNMRELEQMRSENRLKVAQVIRGTHGGVGTREAQASLLDLRREQAGRERQLKLAMGELSNAQDMSLPTEEIEAEIEANKKRLQEIDGETRDLRDALRQNIPGMAPKVERPVPGEEAPPPPERPPGREGPAYGPPQAAPGAAAPTAPGNPRERLDALSRARFGRPYMQLTPADREVIVQQFNTQSP